MRQGPRRARRASCNAWTADGRERCDTRKHQKALVLEDPNARLEYDAYVRLARAYRDIAEKLDATADQMTGYRDLPIARHDERAMKSLDACRSFDEFVTVERELLGYLTTALKRDEAMLEQMRGMCP